MITFTNLLARTRKDNDQVNTRNASIHVIGMQLVNSIASDGSFVGTNASSFAAPDQTVMYSLFAQKEGDYVMYSTDTVGGEADGGQQSAGLLGAINVEPVGARWYRSQVTKNDLDGATVGRTTGGQPLLNYEAVYTSGPQINVPVLNMLSSVNEIIKSDLTATITGPIDPGEPCIPGRPDNDQLVRRCLDGDEHGWEDLVSSYRGLVCHIAARFGASRDDAADILQVVFLDVFSNLSQLKNHGSFRSWLITVTVRQSMRWKQRYGAEVPLDAMEPDAEEISVDAAMPQTVWHGEQASLLHASVAQLPKRNAEMMRLLFFENPPVPYEEVARRLGLARGSIGFIRGRTLAKLRRILIASGYDRRGVL
jgi:RNA polymerase sigma factor (sigma-70 family)